MKKDMKKTKVFIRPAQPSDRKGIKRLIRYLMKVEQVDRPEQQAKLVVKQRITPALHTSKNCVLVAESGGEIIGVILIEMKRNGVAYFPYLVIDSQYQHTGVGRCLLKSAEEYARLRKATVVETMIHKDNGRSRRFHEKLGFRLFGFVFRKKV